MAHAERWLPRRARYPRQESNPHGAIRDRTRNQTRDALIRADADNFRGGNSQEAGLERERLEQAREEQREQGRLMLAAFLKRLSVPLVQICLPGHVAVGLPVARPVSCGG